MIQKSTYLRGVFKKSVVKACLQFLLGQPLYKHCKITVHWDSFHANTSCVEANAIGDDPIELLQCGRCAQDLEVLPARQNLPISETWMEDSLSVDVLDFDLRLYCNTGKRRQIATTSSIAVSLSSSHKAGGVAIYRHINSFTHCNRVNIDIPEINLGMKIAKAVDVCLVNGGETKIMIENWVASIESLRNTGLQHFAAFNLVTKPHLFYVAMFGFIDIAENLTTFWIVFKIF
ncbi:helitron_like_N domain-containing protein [Trichonephila clavipes]|nr:helitron_like_N domain-containing protein [Trichonephila clavipes]